LRGLARNEDREGKMSEPSLLAKLLQDRKAKAQAQEAFNDAKRKKLDEIAAELPAIGRPRRSRFKVPLTMPIRTLPTQVRQAAFGSTPFHNRVSAITRKVS
jgi:hypothetical protein